MRITRFAVPCLAGLTLLSAPAVSAQVILPPASAAVAPVVTTPTTPSEAAPGFSTLFTTLGRDFRQLASRHNLFAAGIGLAGSTSAHPFDASITGSGWVNQGTHPAFSPGSIAGNFLVQASGALATYGVGRVLDRPGVATLGAELFRAQIVAQTTTQALKLGARRTRPDGTTLSFPSGHAAAGFATATVLHAKYGWKAGIPAYAAASWIAASRVQGKRHYLSDVIAGATIGIMAGRSVTIGSGRNRFAVAPMAVSGGIGVSLVRVGAE